MFENARVGDRVWSIRNGWGDVIQVEHFQHGIPPGYSRTPLFVRFDHDDGVQSYTLDGKNSPDDLYPELYWDAIDFTPPPPPERWVEKEKWLAPVVHPRSGLIFATSCGVPKKYDSSHEAIRDQTEYASKAGTEFAQYPEPFKLTWYEKEEAWK